MKIGLRAWSKLTILTSITSVDLFAPCMIEGQSGQDSRELGFCFIGNQKRGYLTEGTNEPRSDVQIPEVTQMCAFATE